FDGPDHVERLLRKIVVFAFADFPETPNRLGERNIDADEAGELLGHVKWLRQEPLDLPGPRDRELVLFGELVHAENGDDVLQFLDVRTERRLISDRGRHAAEQRRYLGVRLNEPENVVDEEEDVLALVVAEILGNGEPGEADARTRTRRLVHLAVDQGRTRD